MDILGSPQGPVSLGPVEQPSSVLPSKSVRELEREIGRQKLLIEVLVRALIDKGLYTRDQLNAIANLVDMEDGVRDGRLEKKKGVKFCSECGRVMMNVSGQCLYCGHQEVLKLV